VLAGREFAGDDETIVVNSDNLYSMETLSLLVAQPRGASYVAGYDRNALLGRSNIEPERVSRLAVVQADAGGNMTRIVEKPERPDDFATDGRVLLSLNCFRFTSGIFAACARIDKSPRGEYELPDAVAYLQHTLGEPVKVLPTTGLFIDMTSRGDIAAVEQLLANRVVGF
jgi:glucose-1-phosphate thymidylyltransferase